MNLLWKISPKFFWYWRRRGSIKVATILVKHGGMPLAGTQHKHANNQTMIRSRRCFVLCRLRVCNVPRLICWFLCYINHLFTFFLTYLLIGIDPFHFKAKGRRKWPNLALVFLCLFCVIVYFVTDVCLLFCVRFRFSVLTQQIGWKECLRNPK